MSIPLASTMPTTVVTIVPWPPVSGKSKPRVLRTVRGTRALPLSPHGLHGGGIAVHSGGGSEGAHLHTGGVLGVNVHGDHIFQQGVPSIGLGFGELVSVLFQTIQIQVASLIRGHAGGLVHVGGGAGGVVHTLGRVGLCHHIVVASDVGHVLGNELDGIKVGASGGELLGEVDAIVITPPFGYWKDRNTNTIELHSEASETVRMVYSLYLQCHGQKEIARRLNALGRKTPAQLRAEQCDREVCAASKTKDGRYVWTYASVKNILVEEAYTGVLINHRSETNSGKAKRLEQAEWYRHANFFPVIIERDIWEKVQQKLKAQARPANGNKAKHRYAGLILCKECGSPFVPMIRYWNGKRRVEYVCKGYHRNGKSYCSSHRIHEEVLDAAVQEFAQTMRIKMGEEQKKLKQKQKMWALRKPVLDAHISSLQKRIRELEQEIDGLAWERITCFRL